MVLVINVKNVKIIMIEKEMEVNLKIVGEKERIYLV